MSETQNERSSARDSYAWCPLNVDERARLRSQIDAGEWKHSWHLPADANGYTDWNNAETIAKIRSVLVDQIAEAKNQLREAERCLTIAVDAMSKMEHE